MKPTNTPVPLLTHDLKIRSSGSSGRDLTERLETYCVDLMGAGGPLEFAQLLQSAEPRYRRALEELLEWTALDNDFALIALVALGPELEFTANRLSRGRPSDDTISEVLTQATLALHWTHELVEGERVDFVVAHALSKTHSEQRRMARHNVPTDPIPDDYEVEEPETAPGDSASAWLSWAVANHVITNDESSLIQESRGPNKSLRILADESGDSYQMLRQRRIRAEIRLRQHLRAQGVER